MSEQYRIYLAVPGTQFCWGTTTGVINSTSKHIVRPFNAGIGFSGAEDFNLCWVDALNLYERGEVTHFAMLHGDIVPDPAQRWLDVLLEEMDKHNAVLVSAHVPIKSFEGNCSCGIGDPTNPWAAYRRFTQTEILQEFPETFNAEMTGYTDRPLLINTGCWVADLRKPIWHEANEDGSLKTIFKFPERVIRGHDGAWVHQRESEDWCLSRELWERGCKDLWITSRVRLTHRGGMEWPNTKPFGKNQHGDEETAWKWRGDMMEKPLSLVQVICLELGSPCNLWKEHPQCPSGHPDRYGTLDTSRQLDNETIVSLAVSAYRDLGFTGLIGWHYYNEPTLKAGRMFELMDAIREQVPRARFILWTNGMRIPKQCEEYRGFDQIVVSGYNEQSKAGRDNLSAAGIKCIFAEDSQLDSRLVELEPQDKSQPCLRPFVEFIIDNYGNHHMCCYDWQGRGTLGNVFTDGLESIAARWREQLPEIVGGCMTENAPQVCQDCGYRWDKYQQHDKRIVTLARAYRTEVSQKQLELQP